MKILASIVVGLVALVVVAVLVLALIGRRPGAGRTSNSVEIAAPPESVFTWITQPERQKQWVSWLVEVRQDRVTPDVVGSIDTWVMDDPNMKQRVEIQSEVLRFEAPRRIDVRVFMKDAFEGTYTYALEPTPQGTRLTMAGTARYLAWIAQLFEPLVTPQAQKKGDDDFARLKRLVESPGR